MLTVAEVKSYLRIENDAEDGLIAAMIGQAKEAAEDFCRREFTEEMPEAVKLACLIFVSHWYENRDSENGTGNKTMWAAFEKLLWPHRDEDKIL